ncbi:hypothetical protein H6P81_019591 [Aristolochia fimbriata]|uniref:Uncharacterized protein n=1 Tax=Aristolochia fimbriata TaxID=158543 RepID=A0AAV7DV40_ARIFI|nr:hypothetical protein H6P81_019591 [Aristolochia fimbriata]
MGKNEKMPGFTKLHSRSRIIVVEEEDLRKKAWLPSITQRSLFGIASVPVRKSQSSVFPSTIVSQLRATSRNLELHTLKSHRIDWELQQVRKLGVLLDKNINIKQITFQINKFTPDGLSELSEILIRNCGVKEVIFSE